MCYDDFSLAKDETIVKILDVEESIPGQFNWPELNVEIGFEAIAHGGRFSANVRKIP